MYSLPLLRKKCLIFWTFSMKNCGLLFWDSYVFFTGVHIVALLTLLSAMFQHFADVAVSY